MAKKPVKPVKSQLLVKGLTLTRKRGKASRDELDERRRMVVRLRLQGKSFKEIAKELGVNYHTVKKDFDSTKRDFLKRVKNFDEKYEIGKTLTVYEQVEQEAWAEFHKSKPGSPSKQKCLDIVRAARNDHVKLLMDTGMMNKAAKKISHEVQPAKAVLKDWTKDDQMMVTLALIQSRMTQQLKGGNGVSAPQTTNKLLDIPQDAITQIPFESEDD